jgi:tRNA threonylcarbamoyl adenosine modification protein YjeE
MTMEKILKSVEETENLAKKIAKYVVAGDVIRLVGDLGVGKSVFARSVIRALGHKGKHIPSPTFTLIQTYDDTRMPVVHVDLYRIDSAEEVEALGLDCWLDHGAILVEWPEKAEEWFPEQKPDLLDFHIMEMDNPGTLTVIFREKPDGSRQVTLSGGDSWNRRLSLVDNHFDRPVTSKERQHFIADCGYRNHVISPVSEDASFRTYWRINTPKGSRIIMDSPPPVESVKPVIKMTKYLEGLGVHVPHIYEQNEKDGFLLLEDFGNTTVRNGILNENKPLEPWYYKAVDVLSHIAASPLPDIREYTKKALWSEVSRFVDWYLPYARSHATHTADRRAFKRMWEPLFDKILDVPQTTVLWDYHADNLMMLTENAPGEGLEDIGVIDFQDARIGPVSYDMSMLLQDVRFEISKDLEERLIQHFLDSQPNIDEKKFILSYRLINLQRTLKIIGGFTRLHARDGKEHYLQYLPRCWEIVDEALRIPECEEMKVFMNGLVPSKRCISA